MQNLIKICNKVGISADETKNLEKPETYDFTKRLSRSQPLKFIWTPKFQN